MNEISKILFQENILIKKEKALSDYKKLTIQHFLAQRNLLKDNETVTVVNMKEILKKLKEKGIFTEKVVDTKRDGLLALFFDKIIHLDIPIFN
jgi:predicted transcriptional regulator YheO